jgi:gliding motility-associated-like protein
MKAPYFSKTGLRTLLIIFPLFLTTKTFAADYFWVGGAGNWSDLAHWSTTSGGTVSHPQIPTANDNVLFDANSFTAANQVVTVNVTTAFCRDMNWTGATNTPILRGTVTNILTVYGSLTLVAGMQFDFLGDVQMQAATLGNRITMAGKAFRRNLTFDNINGEWTFQDDITVDSTISLKNGILRMASTNVNADKLYANAITSGTLDLGNATITLRGGYNYTLYPPVYTFLFDGRLTKTTAGGTHTIRCTSPTAWVRFSEFFSGSVLPFGFNVIEFTATTGSPILQNYNSGTAVTLARVQFASNGKMTTNSLRINTLQLTAGKSYEFESGQTYTIQNLQATGTCTTPILMRSSVSGQTALISATQNITTAFTTIQDIIGSGGGTFTANNSIGVGTTTGWIINQATPQTLYWVGGVGNWNDIQHWATTSGGVGGACLPTANDNVVFDANSFSAAGQTATINIEDAFCKNFTWTNTNTAVLAGVFTNNLHVFGSFSLPTAMNWQFNGRLLFETALAAQDIQTANKTFNNDVVFNGIGGWILRGELRTVATIQYLKGSWNTNSQYVGCRLFRSESTQARTWTLGDTKLEISPLINDNTMIIVTATNMVLDAGRSEIVGQGYANYMYVNGASGNLRFYNLTFFGFGQSVTTYYNYVTLGFNKVTYTSYGTNTTGTMTIDTLVLARNSDNYFTDASGSSTIGLVTTFKVKVIQTAQGCTTGKATLRRGRINNVSVTIEANGVDSVVVQNVVVVDLLGRGNMIANNSMSIGTTTGWTIRRGTSRTLYWVGNTGDWFDPAHWSLTSGGAGGECVPTQEDDVFFDSRSFSIASQRVRTLNSGGGGTIAVVACRNMDWSGVRFNPSFESINVQIHGNLRFAPIGSMSISSSIYVNFLSSTPYTIHTEGQRIGQFTMDGSGIGTLLSRLEVSYATINSGGFITRGQPIGVEYWMSIGNFGTRPTVIRLDSSLLSFRNGFNAPSAFYSFSVAGESTDFNAGTSTIQLAYQYATVSAGSRPTSTTRFNNVIFTNPIGKNLVTSSQVGDMFFNKIHFYGDGDINGKNSIDSLIFSAGKTYRLVAGVTQTVTKYFQMVGNNCESIRLQSLTSGQKATVSMNSGTVLANFVQMSDQAAVGSIQFLAGANSTNIGNSNTGWRFESPANYQNVGFLGRDTSFCDNASFTIAAYASPIATYSWSTGASTPSINITAPGQYTAEVRFGSGCVIKDTILVERIVTPVFDLGNDTVLCRSQTLTLRMPNPTGAIHSWQNGTNTTPQIIVSQAGTYRGEVNLKGCKAKDSIQVSYIDGASFSLGNDTTLCAGQSLGYNFSINGANFRWSDGATTPQYSINRSGTYWLEVTANGCSIRDSVRVNVLDPGTFSLGRDTALCAGQSLRLNAFLPNATYRWQDGSTDSVFTVRAQGQYFVQASVSNCRVLDTILVVVNPLPIFTLGNDTTLCAGQNLTYNFNLANANYRWSDGTTTPQYNINRGGTYWLEVTSNNCSVRDSLRVGYIDPGTFTLGRDTAICEGQTVRLRANVPNAIYRWQDNSTDSVFTVRTQGQYSVQASVANCRVADTILVVVNPLPRFTLGNDTTLCAGQNLAYNFNLAGANYRWNDGTTAPQYNINRGGTYWLEVTSNNCSVRDSLRVGYIDPGTFTLGRDTTICEGQTVRLRANVPNATYRWQDNSTDSVFTVRTQGQYSVQASVSNCRVADTILVNVNPIPRFDLGKDTTLCEAQTVTLTAAAQTGSTYRWQNGTTLSTFNVTTAGTYKVVATLGTCTAADSIVVAFASFPTLDLGRDTSICESTTYTLRPLSNATSFRWQNGATTATFPVQSAGLYHVEATNIAGCKRRDSIQIEVTNLPRFNLGNDTAMCVGKTHTLTATVTDATIRWQNSTNTTPTLAVNQTGTFAATATRRGCLFSDSIKVTFAPPPQYSLGRDTTICDNIPIALQVNVPNSKYVWSDNSTNSKLTVSKPGTYWVAVTTNLGCRSADSILIQVKHCPSFEAFVPNVFSPNDDTFNDVLKPFFPQEFIIKGFEFEIFNRWGGLVFRTDIKDTGWDGMVKGTKAPIDVYVYRLKVTYEKLEGGTAEKNFGGDCMLVR